MGIPLVGGCRGPRKLQAKTGSPDLYIIFLGPWLLWDYQNDNDLTVLTTICSHLDLPHDDSLADALGTSNPTDLTTNTPYLLSLTALHLRQKGRICLHA